MANHINIYVNPAERLHFLLSTLALQTHDIKLLELWSSILDIPTSDRPNLFYAITLIEKIPDMVKERMVNTLPESYTKYLSWHESISSSLKANYMFGQLKSIAGNLTPQNLSLIDICADQLRLKNFPDGHVTRVEKQANKMYRRVGKIQRAILSDIELDDDLRAMLMAQLSSLDRALIEFKVLGSPGNIIAIEQMAGIALAHKDVVERHKGSPYMKRIIRLAGVYMITVGFMQHTEWVLDKAKDIGLLPQVTETIKQMNDSQDVGNDNKMK